MLFCVFLSSSSSLPVTQKHVQYRGQQSSVTLAGFSDGRERHPLHEPAQTFSTSEPACGLRLG